MKTQGQVNNSTAVGKFEGMAYPVSVRLTEQIIVRSCAEEGTPRGVFGHGRQPNFSTSLV